MFLFERLGCLIDKIKGLFLHASFFWEREEIKKPFATSKIIANEQQVESN